MNVQEAETLARTLMDQHGLQDWAFAYDGALRRFGLCSYRRKTIYLSWHLVLRNDEPQVRDTILHEIAHALAPGEQHSARWRDVARRVGAKPERCYSEQEVEAPEPDIHATCTTCAHVFKRWRFPTRPTACSHCCRRYARGRYDERFLLKWVLQR